MESQNTKVVQDAFAAFSRGDVPGILATLTDDVAWIPVYGAGPDVPTAGERLGKASVGEFFARVATHLHFSTFEPREFIASGDKVVALGHYTATTPLGGTVDSDFAMVFTLRNGQVAAFQEFCDSAALNAAFATPEPIAAAR
jgi:ketosteroid isomerase-like protein